MFKFLLISRYLQKRTLVLFSAGGMTIAVMVFIVIFSVLDGFGRGIVARLRGTMADVIIEDEAGRGIADYEIIMRDLESNVPEIEVCSPFIERIAMFQSAFLEREIEEDGYARDVSPHIFKAQYGLIRGIDPCRETKMGDLKKYLAKGGFYRTHPGVRAGDILQPGLNQVIVGEVFPLPLEHGFAANDSQTDTLHIGFKQLPINFAQIEGETFSEKIRAARKLFGPGLSVRSSALIIYSLRADSPVPGSDGRFTVRGRFKTGDALQDRMVVLMHYKDTQKLLGMEGRGESALTGAPSEKSTVSGISVKLKPEACERLDSIKPAINRVLQKYGGGYKVRGWTEIRRKMLDAVAMEKALTFIILSCIILALGVGIFAIQSFSVIRHTRDIGIMKAIGVTDNGVMSVFLGISTAVGVVGAVLGVMLGITIAANVNEILAFVKDVFGWELFPSDTFYIERLHTAVCASTYLTIAGIAILVCILAGLIPAKRAARRDAVRCLVVE